MRILFLGNNWMGWQILQWLKEQGEEIVGLVMHPPDKRKFGDEIVHCAGLRPRQILDGSKLKDPDTMAAIKDMRPDIGISALFGFILKKEILELLPLGCVNIHPALLPYNRGAYPNVWSIVEGTPAGTTIHYIDEGVDTGDIIAQRQVNVMITDTGESLYHKLAEVSLDLFQEVWPSIRNHKAPRIPQKKASGTCHRVQDIDLIDEIDLMGNYRAQDLLNIIRARTFLPYKGAFFNHQGRKVYMRLQLWEEGKDLEQEKA
jgi:methionyl-tRNA formyltransferase